MRSTIKERFNACFKMLPNRHQTWLFFGLSVLYGLADLSLFSFQRTYSLTLGAGTLGEELSSAFVLTIALLVVTGLFLLHRKGIEIANSYSTLLICSVLMAITPAVWLLSPFFTPHPLFGLVLLSLFVLGHICYIPILVKSMATAGTVATLVFFSISRIILALIFPFIDAVPQSFYATIMLVGPFGLYYFARCFDKSTQKASKKTKQPKDRLPFLLIATLFIVGAPFVSLQFYTEALPDFFIAIRSFGMFISAVVIVYLALYMRLNFNRLLFVVGIPAMVLGMLLVNLQSDILAPLASILYTSSRSFTNGIIFALFAYLIRYSSFNYYSLATLGYASLFAGELLSLLLMIGLDNAGAPAFTQLSMASVVVFFIMLCAMLLYGNNNMKSNWGSISPQDTRLTLNVLEEACEVVAKKAKLTPRETDVLKLLAQGRNSGNISKQLVISEGTSKTHVKHVYQKMNVHSQQELIDAVEETKQNL